MELTIIPLRRTVYSDTRAILTAYSRERGVVSLLIAAGAGREAARRRALLQPGSVVACTADIKPGRDIYPARNFMPAKGSLAFEGASPEAALTAMFLTEVLEIVLRETDRPEPLLFDFIAASFECLRELPAGRVANFHLVFLYHLASMEGLEPDLSTWRQGCVFDIRAGVFTTSYPLHNDVLTGGAAKMVRTLSRLNYSNMHHVRLTRAERNDCLDGMLRYMSVHLGAERLGGALKTLDVARTLL